MAQVPKTEFHKAASKTLLFTGLIIAIIGGFFYFVKNKIWGAGVLFIGLMIFVYWLANRKDEVCTFDANDNMHCEPIKK